MFRQQQQQLKYQTDAILSALCRWVSVWTVLYEWYENWKTAAVTWSCWNWEEPPSAARDSKRALQLHKTVPSYYYYYYKLERVQRKFAALCHKRFFQDMEYYYDILLEKLNLHTLHIRRRHIDALFLINAFCGTKNCPFVLETVRLRVLTRNIRNFTTFSCSFSHCPSARCVSAANAVCKSTDIFSKPCLSV
jgi:hypothetical protein